MTKLRDIVYGLCWLLIWMLRLRFALLVALAPLLVGIAAWNSPHMLLGLLLVRPGTPCWDLLVITTMSLFTVALGIGLARLLTLNAADRFPAVSWLLTGGDRHAKASREKRKPQQGWPGWLIAVWWVVSLVLPLLCVAASLHDGATKLGWMATGIVCGLIAGNVITVIVTGLQQWTLGHIDDQAQAGILPWESFFGERVNPWQIGKFRIPGKSLFRYLFGEPNRGFSWLLRGPGFTDPLTGLLKPGHAQALIVAFVSAVLYTLRYYRDLGNQTWEPLNWPTVFFGLVAIYITGWFITGLAFWLDRYNIPTTLVAAGYIAAIYGITDTDHRFELNPRDLPPDYVYGVPDQRPPRPAADAATANLFLKAIADRRPDQKLNEQVDWPSTLQAWTLPGDARLHNRTLVVVATSGGGIQAAAWTAEVLSELDRECPGMGQSIGLTSSVSGGSVGVMYYLGFRGVRNNQVTDFRPVLTEETRKLIFDKSSESALEVVGWGLAFPDLVRTILPVAAPTYVDRGWAMESVWWNRMANGLRDRLAMSRVSIRDLVPLIQKGESPAVIFNATCVDTGQRVLITPVKAKFDNWQTRLTDDDGAMKAAVPGQADEPDLRNYVMTPIDFLQFYDQALQPLQMRADPRISTAVRLSASFAYVTPVSRPAHGRLTSQAKRADGESAFQLHFCDGGYADNAGLVTAVRYIQQVLEAQKAVPVKQRRFDRILLVRIEPFPNSIAEQAKASGFQSSLLGPVAALYSSRTSTQAERGELEVRLLQEANGPAQKIATSLSDARMATANLVEEYGLQFPLVAKEVESLVHGLPISLTDAQLAVNFEQIDQRAARLEGDLNSTIGKINKLKVPRSLVRHQVEIVGKLNEAKQATSLIKSVPAEDAPPITVDSITFRFGEYLAEELKRDHDATVPLLSDVDRRSIKDALQPRPLTWTLSEVQKQAIKTAWKVRRSFNNEKYWKSRSKVSADTLSPEGLQRFFPRKVAK